MSPEQREEAIKAMSYAIGLCPSIKPERMAAAALQALEEKYNILEKTAGDHESTNNA